MFETFQASLLSLDPDVDDAVRIDRLKELEACQSATAAAMAREAARFAESQRAKQVARGVPAQRVGLGIASQVGLARRMSPFAASRYLAKVEVLTSDLPETFAKLTSGEVSEQRALIVAKEVSWLRPKDRQQVDAEIASQVVTLGTKRLVDAVKKIAYRLDPTGFLKRIKVAQTERCVTSRPADAAMMRLTLLLPMIPGVGAYAALRAAAMARRGIGDETRSLDQLMADIAVVDRARTGPGCSGRGVRDHDRPDDVQLRTRQGRTCHGDQWWGDSCPSGAGGDGPVLDGVAATVVCRPGRSSRRDGVEASAVHAGTAQDADPARSDLPHPVL
jgi:hypothetical protein